MIEDKKQDFDQVIEHFKLELAKLRTGRANPVILEDVKVDYYGASMPLRQLASISVPEPRQLLVQPWDKNALIPLEQAIRNAGLGLGPVNEGDKLRISLPELTEERRKELVKLAGKIAEESRVRVRAIREEIWRDIQKKETVGDISEDEKFKLKEKLQEVIDEYNKKIKDLADKKEQEIMTI